MTKYHVTIDGADIDEIIIGELQFIVDGKMHFVDDEDKREQEAIKDAAKVLLRYYGV